MTKYTRFLDLKMLLAKLSFVCSVCLLSSLLATAFLFFFFKCIYFLITVYAAHTTSFQQTGIIHSAKWTDIWHFLCSFREMTRLAEAEAGELAPQLALAAGTGA